MKYLCLACGDGTAWESLTKEQQATFRERCRVYDAELAGDGRVRLYAGLQDGGKVVRHRGGKRTVTDGPFIESKEIGGVFVVEAADLDEAVELASLHPAGRMGEELGWHVEVRPLWVPEPAQGG
ncbi:MAG TPA: YciI family protein [Gemmatimonadales bacterium]|jgi:hypothetical protein